MASIDERFQAAVNVIKGLPKNGPYQPSTSMMLKFYGLFKQATEGAVTQKKPGFWDVVGKAKWDAWNDNRHLSKEQAMLRYVDCLREIIETMSFTENVQNFVGSLDSLSNINLDELDLVSPGMRELAESHPNSPFHSRTNSPQHGASTNGEAEEQEEEAETTEAAVATTVEVPTTNGHHLTNGYVSKPTTTSSVALVEPSDDEYDDPYDLTHELTTLTQAITRNTELLRQIQSTVTRMNTDVTRVQQRLNGVEQTIQQLSGRFKGLRQQPVWWPFKDISPLWFALLVLWPFLVRRFASLLNTNKQRR